MNGERPKTPLRELNLSPIFEGNKDLNSFGKAVETTVVYEIRKPHSMIRDYTLNCEFAQEKQRQGYILKALVFRRVVYHVF